MMGSLREQKKDRIAGFESVKAQLYPLAEAHQWLKKRAKRRDEKEGAECCKGSHSAESFGKIELCCGGTEMQKEAGCRTDSRAKEAEREDRWEMGRIGRWEEMRVSNKRGNDERRSHERGIEGQGSEERGSDERGSDERGSNEKERRCNMLRGVAVCCIILWVMTMCVSAPQGAASCCDELLWVAVCGGVLQLGASVAGSRAGRNRVADRYSVFKHVVAHYNVLCQWMLQPKKENKDKTVVIACSKLAQGVREWCQMFRCVMVCSGWLKWVEACCSVLCVGTGRTVLLWAAGCRNALKWVASKFRYINIYDNRYVNRNRCVYKDKCTWDVGECMKANFNYLYEQNKDISTSAVADEEKGNTTVDRATCVCIRCSIVFRQVERSQEGGISVARGSFDGSGSVDGASEAMRNCAVAVEGANGGVGVAHVAGEALVMGVGVVFGQGVIEAAGGRDKGACDGGECGGCGCEGDGGDGANSDEDQIVFGCDLIAQRTFLPRGDSGGGSVCDDKSHGNGIGNDCRGGGDDSGGQSRRTSSDSDSNGGSGVFKDFDGFKDNRGFAGICNSESVSDYNGGVWDYVNAVKGVANGGSNSGDVRDIGAAVGSWLIAMVLRLVVVTRLAT